MSAYIVDDNTINRVLAYLRENPETSKEYLGKTLENGEAIHVGQDMFLLNQQAVDQRYEVGTAEQDHPLPYQYQGIPAVSPLQTLKSLKCWLYQCQEGTIPETHLFHEFSKLADHLCWEIVYNLPEYDKAEWA